MAENNPPDYLADCRAGASISVHIFCYILISVILVVVLIVRSGRPFDISDYPAGEPTRVGQVEQRIDPNAAQWAELARLPEIGETLAKRIVAYRDEQRLAANTCDHSLAVFSQLEDLIVIKGIGHKCLARIGPGLKFPAPQGRPTR